MIMMRLRFFFEWFVCLGILLTAAPDIYASENSDSFRSVTDQRGVSVKVPMKIERVVTICDGLVESVMTALGVQNSIVGLGSACIPKHWEYTYPTVAGESYDYTDGMNTVTFLNPFFMDLPLVAQSGTGINYETLASLNPDVVFLRAGSCTLSANDESTHKTIRMIESLGIPLVVLFGPNMTKNPKMDSISEEIRIIGRALGNEQKATALAEYLEKQVRFVMDRTREIPEDQKPSVLLFGLSPKSREAGGTGHVRGLNTIDSWLVETVVNARNAFRTKGSWNILGTEQVLAIDPDVIVLITAWGYHPPRELYEAPYYQNLKDLRAVKNRRVTALPWTPCNCDKRVEYPIDVMIIAKAAYPEKFADVDLNVWLLDFYQNVYGVDPNTAAQLRAVQWMNWVTEKPPH
jgi:iron complex transport system substrate-binding protein|uniref:Solute-binding protein of iron ABC transporter n=2 Tax=Desulfotignum balticum TaxID=115781 RepID=B2DD70_9BACT|nr:solute-binding protein of iron ABC transporter [Desulfotignum balticum]